MADDRLATLYKWSELMAEAGDGVKEKHENEYKEIINYVKTSENPKERILAAQLISRFFKYFPEHEHEAFDSIVDLCESADVDVRKLATMAMITICRECKQVVSKAADILIQLYQTDQPSEVNLINQSLMTLLNLDIEKFLKSFYANFEDGSEVVRERALKFLSAKIHTVPETALTKEIEEQLLNYTKKAMEDVTKDEFTTFIGILSKLKIAKTSAGQATIMSSIKSKAEMDKDFDVSDKVKLEDNILLCCRLSMPFLSQYNRASEFVNYICLKVLPHLKELAPTGHDIQILQTLAEMSPHTMIDDAPEFIDLDSCLQTVYDTLVDYLPKPTPPPEEVSAEEGPKATDDAKKADEASEVEESNEKKEEAEKSEAGGDTATEKSTEEKTEQKSDDFQIRHIEYLMYTFMQLCRLKPEWYDESMQVASRKLLPLLSTKCKKNIDLIEKDLRLVKAQDLNKEENKLISDGLRATKNICAMILGLFKKPADFKLTLILSCKPPPVVAKPERSQTNTSSSRPTGQQVSKSSHNRPYQRRQNNNGNHHHNGNNNNRSQSGNYSQRQVGQKSKFRGNYQNDYRNKRPRQSR